MEEKGTMHNPEKIVRKYGYEYVLVECFDRPSSIGKACALGFPNYALKTIRKIKKDEKRTN